MFLANTQNTFYIVGIVFMIFSMVIMVALLVGVIMIASRIKSIQNNIKEKLNFFNNLSKKGKGFLDGFRRGLDS